MNDLNSTLALHQRYTHHGNVPNRTIFCHDNLEILQGINSECIDLIYLDPPFNKKKTFTAPIGSSAEGASFKDIFTLEDIKDEWVQTIQEDQYAIYRLLEAVKDVEGRTSYNFCPDWRGYNPAQSRRHWSVPQRILKALVGEKNIDTLSITQKLNLLDTHNYILVSKNNIPRFKQYLHEMDGVPCQDIWTDIPPAGKNEQTGYPTQKPLALLERIIKASSKKDDVVLDPFCGCATTCVAAEKLERHWIGIDISIKAYDFAKNRFKQEKAINFQTDPPQRTDEGEFFDEG